MQVGGGVGVAEVRHVEAPVDQRGAGEAHHQECEQRPPRHRCLHVGREREGSEHQDGRDPGADRRLGKSHIHRVQGDEQRRRVQAVQTEQHRGGEQLPDLEDRERRDRHEAEQGDVDQELDCDPSSSSPRGRNPPCSAALASACDAVGLVKIRNSKISTSFSAFWVGPA